MEEERRPLLKFNIEYNEKDYLALNKFHIYVLERYMHLTIYAMLFLIISISIYFANGFEIKSIICSILVVIYTIFVKFYPFLFNFLQKKYRNRKIGLKVEYLVFNEYMKVKTENQAEYEDVLFKKLYRVYENKTHFFLYINKKSAYIVSKKKISGNISNFRNIIKINIGNKYKKIV